MARRLHAIGTPGYEVGFNLALHEGRLTQPLLRRVPTVYFVNSMSDLFHKDVPDSFLDRVFNIIRATRRECPGNVWLGVSVENKRSGIPRIAELVNVEAHVRFLSIEPLLEDVGAIDLTGIHWVIVGGESAHQARRMSPQWVRNVKRQCDAARVAFFFKQWGRFGPDGVARSKGANGRELRGRTWDAYPKQAANADRRMTFPESSAVDL
jgi:protein gp37